MNRNTSTAVAQVRRRMSLRAVAPHIAIPVVIFAVAVYASGDGYTMHLATSAAIAYVLTASFNLVFGYAGIFSMASIALYGVGAYASVYFVNQHGFSFWLALPLAIALSAAVGALIILPTGHLKSIFIAIATLGFAVSVAEIFTQWTSVTGGAAGIYQITSPQLGSIDLIPGTMAFLLFCCVFAWISAEISWRIGHSGLGRKLIALRESPRVLPAVGVDAAKVRFFVFVLSSAMAGLAGALHAHFQLTISPEGFGIGPLIGLLLATVIGGAGTFLGPVVGVGVLLLIDEVGANLGGAEPLAYGLSIVILMAVGREGLVPALENLGRAAWRELGRRSSKVALLSKRDKASNSLEATGSEPNWSRPGVQSGELVVENVDVAFGGVKAVVGMSLTVKPAEILGLIGPNGAGKTSLFNAITGEVPAESRQISLDGKKVKGQRSYQRRQVGLARTFQIPTLVGDLTLIENVMLGGELRSKAGLFGQALNGPAARRDDRQHRAEGMRYLEEFRIANLAHEPVGSQPYGVQRLTEIARCLMLHPAILLLDEPGAGLTTEGRMEVARVARDLSQQGLSVLVIDHNVGFIRSMCDRIVAMNSGSFVAEGSPDQILSHPEVISSYLGKAEVGHE